jgi:hypothetical protein
MWSASRTGATSTAVEAPSAHRPGPMRQAFFPWPIGPGRCETSENSVTANFGEFLFHALR